MSEASSTQWKCFLCWKWNDDWDQNQHIQTTHCMCCQRERTFVPKSVIIPDRAKPLALHGISNIQHPYRVEQLKTLTEMGLDLTSTANNGWTPLHCAARMGQDQVLVNLLSLPDVRATSSLECTSVGGWRALHHAVHGGHIRCVEELLLASVDINARLNTAEDGLTPLHLAAKLGHELILELLMQCGADVHVFTHALGRSALHLAVEYGHLSCTRLLAIKTDLIEYVDNDGISPLQQAHMLSTSSSKIEIIQLLDSVFRQRTLGQNPRLLPADMLA